MSKNKAASIRARLKNIANREQKQFDFILMLYFVERLLYRLSISRYGEQFILKGGLLLYTIMDEKARATKDIDLLAKGISIDLDEMKNIFKDISSIYIDDSVIYDTNNIIAERIKEDADYEGVRIKITASLENIRKTLQFDIGFGDVIVPKPQIMEYPTLLDMDKPVIKTYSKESIISEKFEAMLYLAEANSRMKDFYDIYNLCTNFDFDGRVLYEAITQTLIRRATPISKNPVIFTEAFAAEKSKQIQWNAFKRRANVNGNLEFYEVLRIIKVFLEPILNCVIEENEFFGYWTKAELIWMIKNVY